MLTEGKVVYVLDLEGNTIRVGRIANILNDNEIVALFPSISKDDVYRCEMGERGHMLLKEKYDGEYDKSVLGIKNSD